MSPLLFLTQPPFTGSRKKTMDAILSKKIHMPYYFTADAKDLLSKVSCETLSLPLTRKD
jgi:hypothetical protein